MSPSPREKPVLLVALGGNALIRKGQRGTIEEQFENLAVPVRQIARLSRRFRIVLTHGNGPQVGDLLLQQECCHSVPRLPLEILVAQTQGQIGYMIESTLDAELTALRLDTSQYLVTVLSYVVVDENDPAFAAPSKPIGPPFTEDEARNLSYPTVKTAKGYRRVVASPRPVTIVERREIRRLIDAGFLVIACGGGGIPVIREGRAFQGVDAVIDKDLASARLALDVGCDVFCIATDVPGAALDFGTAAERFLPRLTRAEAERLLREGAFPAGSMGPKVQACCEALQSGKTRALITSIAHIEEAVTAGAHATEIVEG